MAAARLNATSKKLLAGLLAIYQLATSYCQTERTCAVDKVRDLLCSLVSHVSENNYALTLIKCQRKTSHLSLASHLR